MGEEFYCVIKLISGEEIFSLVSIDENDGDPIIIMQSPVVMKVIHNHLGSCIKIKSWMEIPNDDIFVIKMDKIITMTEVNDDSVISVYNKYINNEEDDSQQLIINDNGKVQISNKMGYISSVEDARKKLENLFKDTKDKLDSSDQP